MILGSESESNSAAGIHYLGFVQDRETMADYYRAADLYLHAAKSELFGLVLAESLACGTPVIATKVGGIAEVFRHGIEGFLVPPGDSATMAELSEILLTDPKKYEQFSEAAISWARKNYNISRCASDYLSWFEEILEGQCSSQIG
jgi:glycosyltransferase involved in cell wall biosynthesis